MGIVEKIGRKLLAGSRSSESAEGSLPDSSGAAHGTAVGSLDHQGKCRTRHGYVHLDAAKGQPGFVQTTVVEPSNDSLSTTRSTKASENQTQSQNRNAASQHAPPVQPQISHIHIFPPTSGLVGNQLGSHRAGPQSTSQPAVHGSRQDGVPPLTTVRSRGHANGLQKKPSVASSLHSSHSGRTGHSGHTGNRGRANTMPENMQRAAGMSTRRMEESAYHAGFKDAIAQLERERQGRGRGPGVSQ